MFNNDEKKKVIIVCTDRTKTYGYLLLQLISTSKKYNAAIWNEKAFVDNEPQISSDTKVVFIGVSKMSKNVQTNIELKYNEFGMQYGWLGNRAILNVTKEIMDKVRYSQFINQCKNDTEVLEILKKDIISSSSLKKRNFHLFIPVFWGNVAIELLNNDKIKKSVNRQQHKYLIAKFYLLGLGEFMEA